MNFLSDGLRSFEDGSRLLDQGCNLLGNRCRGLRDGRRRRLDDGSGRLRDWGDDLSRGSGDRLDCRCSRLRDGRDLLGGGSRHLRDRLCDLLNDGGSLLGYLLRRYGLGNGGDRRPESGLPAVLLRADRQLRKGWLGDECRYESHEARRDEQTSRTPHAARSAHTLKVLLPSGHPRQTQPAGFTTLGDKPAEGSGGRLAVRGRVDRRRRLDLRLRFVV